MYTLCVSVPIYKPITFKLAYMSFKLFNVHPHIFTSGSLKLNICLNDKQICNRGFRFTVRYYINIPTTTYIQTHYMPSQHCSIYEVYVCVWNNLFIENSETCQ